MNVEKSKAGPHLHESIKYVVIITTVSILGVLVISIMAGYGYSPFSKKNENVVRTSDHIPVAFINNINIDYQDLSGKDYQIPDKYDENYTEKVTLVGMGILPHNAPGSEKGFIPVNYKDYYGV